MRGRRIGLAYFHERGFRDDIIRTFQLGYVPEMGAAFSGAARARGFDADCWNGRLDQTPRGWERLDFFAGRVTFPCMA
ncbi:MAG: hypothetical protein IPK99_17810 [Flavobacteriales bacterium]|nr:hypothetical protein [Flavobacteriales bacterium]